MGYCYDYDNLDSYEKKMHKNLKIYDIQNSKCYPKPEKSGNELFEKRTTDNALIVVCFMD